MAGKREGRGTASSVAVWAQWPLPQAAPSLSCRPGLGEGCDRHPCPAARSLATSRKGRVVFVSVYCALRACVGPGLQWNSTPSLLIPPLAGRALSDPRGCEYVSGLGVWGERAELGMGTVGNHGFPWVPWATTDSRLVSGARGFCGTLPLRRAAPLPTLPRVLSSLLGHSAR